MEKSFLKMIAKILAFAGGVNWGLVGVSTFVGDNYNFVNLLLGGQPVIEAVVYILIGLSAVYLVLPGRS